MNIKNKLQIIIITYNRAEKLNKTLIQLLENDSPVKEYNILILDNNSTDNTSDLVKKFQIQHKNLSYIKNNINVGMGGNITKAIELANKDYIWILGDDDNYCWDNWNEVEEGITNDKDIICVSNEDLSKNKKSLDELLFQLVFLPAGIWKKSLVNDTIMRNVYDNVYTIMPHLCPMIYAINKGANIQIVSKSIANYGYDGNTDVSYSRGNINEDLYPKVQKLKFIVCYANIINGLKNKEHRKQCLDFAIRNKKIYNGYKHFYINMVKHCCNDKQLSNWVDVFVQLYPKHKFILAIKTIIKFIINLFRGTH